MRGATRIGAPAAIAAALGLAALAGCRAPEGSDPAREEAEPTPIADADAERRACLQRAAAHDAFVAHWEPGFCAYFDGTRMHGESRLTGAAAEAANRRAWAAVRGR